VLCDLFGCLGGGGEVSLCCSWIGLKLLSHILLRRGALKY
jgi:hypothetical protein